MDEINDLDVPRAVDAEAGLLAVSLWSPDAFAEAQELISDDEFYLPQHRAIWAAMRALAKDGQVADVAALQVVLGREAGAAPLLAVLLKLATMDVAPSVQFFASEVERAFIAREVVEACKRGAQGAVQAFQSGVGDPAAVAADTAVSLEVAHRMATPPPSRAIDVLDMVAEADDPEDVVLPKLLNRGERIIITAPEGYGKSTLLRQIGCCAAGGLHPFKPEGIEPKRVLVYDAENPDQINRHEYRRMLGYLEHIGHTPRRGQLLVDRQGPVNLLDGPNSSPGRKATELFRLVEKFHPDLIIIGPIYQLHEEDANDERAARKLTVILDKIRGIGDGAAVITEAHTPHSDGPGAQLLRPFGSSLWKRWPEFGYCLHPTPDQKMPGEDGMVAREMRSSHFTPWRGARGDAREWPKTLEKGFKMPWTQGQFGG